MITCLIFIELFFRSITKCTVQQRKIRQFLNFCLDSLSLSHGTKTYASAILSMRAPHIFFKCNSLKWLSKKFMFCINLILYGSDWTWTNVHSINNFLRILLAPHCYLSIFNTDVIVITAFTHDELYISFMFLSFTLLGGNSLYNSCRFIYFTILGA